MLQTINDSNLTGFLRICIQNANKIEPGFSGNRYEDVVKKLGVFFYIQGGKKLYQFLHVNLNFPSFDTLKNTCTRNLQLFEKI